jgi:hypothetical protein
MYATDKIVQSLQFNTHMVESVLSNRLIAPDAETRIWKNADKFTHGEFVENVRLGGAIYPTLANVNHSCDPNLILLNWNNRAVAVANRPIAAGEQIFDTYGALYYNMAREDRQAFLKVGHRNFSAFFCLFDNSHLGKLQRWFPVCTYFII